MGPPGAGKGTQALNIANEFKITHISTGDIFRENLKKETPLGKEAKSYMDQGLYVPDEVTNRIVEDRLTWPDTANGFLLDGYPRTLDQVKFLDQLLAKKNQKLDKVIELVVDTKVVIERLVKRAKEQNRIDDTEEVIAKRLDVYKNETSPLIEEFEKRGIVEKIDGMASVNEVSEKIFSKLKFS